MISDISPEAAGSDTGEALKPAASSSHPSAHERTGNPTAAEPERTGNPTAAKPERTGNPTATEPEHTSTPTAAKPEYGSRPKESVTRRRLRGTESSPEAGNADTAKLVPTLTLDEETDAALILFNTYLEADRARRQHERDVKKAEKAKADAAVKVRQLKKRESSSADMAEAEASYRETVDALNRLKQSKQGGPNKQSEPADAD